MASQKPGTDYSEPEYIKSKDRAEAPFYHPNIDHKLIPEVWATPISDYLTVPVRPHGKTYSLTRPGTDAGAAGEV